MVTRKRRSTASNPAPLPNPTLERALNAISDFGVIGLTAEGRVSLWNTCAEKITGYSASEIRGRAFSTLLTTEDEKNGRINKELELVVSEGRTVELTLVG